MKLKQWSFSNLKISVLEMDDGSIVCSNGALADALQVTEASLLQFLQTSGDKLTGAPVTDLHLKEFARISRVELGFSRVRSNIVLWTAADMIRLAIWSRSPVADEFVDGLIDFVKTHSQKQALGEEVAPQANNEDLMRRLESLEKGTKVTTADSGHIKLKI